MPQLTWLFMGTSSGLGEQFLHRILAKGDRVIAVLLVFRILEAISYH